MYLVNGLQSDVIPITDRGFHYADGLFETIAVKDGKPLLFDRHLARLAYGCERLGIAVPDRPVLEAETQQICGGVPRQVLKIIVTRGSGGRGYRPEGAGVPTRVLAALPWPDYAASHRTQGVAVRFCQTRLGSNPALAGLKHLARLEQVLARGEWSDPAVQEGLMLDGQSCVVEATMSNLFLVCGEDLVTPVLGSNGVQGVMREAVMACAARLGIHCEERPVSLEALHAADGLFLTNSLIGVWPVRKLHDRTLEIPPLVPALLSRLIEEGACV